ncbi:MAG: GAF domain-containing protein [Phycisphaerae bacterium]|nr:GAF domain-containing protein [Phycisphaerae bacterium]
MIWSFAHDLSLKSKLIAIVMLTCVAALVLTGGVFAAWEWTTLHRGVVRDLTTHASILADNCRAAVTFRDTADAGEILQTVEPIPSIVVACVYAVDGELLATYVREGSRAAVPLAGDLKEHPVFSAGLLTLTQPVLLDEERIGTVCLCQSLDFMYGRIRRGATVILCVLFLSSVAAYIVSSRLQRIISRPILHLADVARLVSDKQQYSVRAQHHGKDEVGLLIDAFNEMLQQIEQRDAALVDANERLEARVQERTAELTTANRNLVREIAFRKQAEQVLVQRTETLVNHQRTLLRFTKEIKGDLQATTKMATEEAAKTLDVEQVSIWFFHEQSSELVCEQSYSLSGKDQGAGIRLRVADYPAYFDAIENSRILAVKDAREDPRTRAFSENYFKPLGIMSLMDVPIRLHGKLLGVMCYEHVGAVREWSLEEQDFAASVADMIALQAESNERRKLERALAKANEHLAETVRDLRRSNKELQDFAYVAAHDLKAPLRGIGTLTDWIASDYADRFDEQGRQQLRLLKGRVSRLSELIDGILHYSEIGRVARRQEPVDLNQFIPETIALLNAPKHIKVVVEGPLPVVVCEKVRVGQVFRNLIDNAVKYMDKPEGRIVIGCSEQLGFWRFSISDNGPGIEAKYFEKIFQIFQTLAPRDERESTGIGLAIVKKIVELCGGSVWVESNVGQGTTFFFTLPKHKVAAEPDPLSPMCVSLN